MVEYKKIPVHTLIRDGKMAVLKLEAVKACSAVVHMGERQAFKFFILDAMYD